MSESRLPSLNSSIQINLYELERLIKELENCVEALKKAIHLHLYLSCNSAIHSKDCQSLRNAKSSIEGLTRVSSTYPKFKYVQGDTKPERHFSVCIEEWRSSILKQFHNSYHRTKSLCSWSEFPNLRENYSLDEKTHGKNCANAASKRFPFQPTSTPQRSWEDTSSSSFCEILQVAQENLDNALLAIKEYELVAWDITSVMGTEEKVIIIRAKELCRKADVFDKMTDKALAKLNTLSIEDDEEENLDESDDVNIPLLPDIDNYNQIFGE